MLRTLIAIVVAAACSSPQHPPASPPPEPSTVVEFDLQAQPPPGDPNLVATPAANGTAHDRTLPQPPDLKLALGHYTDAKHNIGLVIDRTRKEAWVRFDHVPQILRLDAIRSTGRTDYVKTINQVVLQVYDNGRVVVFVPGTSESIDVVRDGDAEPL